MALIEEQIKDRIIWRKAMALCLSHSIECDCQGCTDMYVALYQFIDKEEHNSIPTWTSKQAESLRERDWKRINDPREMKNE